MNTMVTHNAPKMDDLFGHHGHGTILSFSVRKRDNVLTFILPGDERVTKENT